jgi:ribosomal protein L30/L7E
MPERHEANLLLLALHQGWTGVFVDGDPRVAGN